MDHFMGTDTITMGTKSKGRNPPVLPPTSNLVDTRSDSVIRRTEIARRKCRSRFITSAERRPGASTRRNRATSTAWPSRWGRTLLRMKVLSRSPTLVPMDTSSSMRCSSCQPSSRHSPCHRGCAAAGICHKHSLIAIQQTALEKSPLLVDLSHQDRGIATAWQDKPQRNRSGVAIAGPLQFVRSQ